MEDRGHEEQEEEDKLASVENEHLRLRRQRWPAVWFNLFWNSPVPSWNHPVPSCNQGVPTWNCVVPGSGQ